MIKQYLKLQLTMGKRRLADFGIHPLAGVLLLAVAFVVLSVFLFSRIAFAGYAYILVALLLIMPYAESNRNDFLKFTTVPADTPGREYHYGVTLPVIPWL